MTLRPLTSLVNNIYFFQFDQSTGQMARYQRLSKTTATVGRYQSIKSFPSEKHRVVSDAWVKKVFMHKVNEGCPVDCPNEGTAAQTAAEVDAGLNRKVLVSYRDSG